MAESWRARSLVWDALAQAAEADSEIRVALNPMSPFAFMRMVDAVVAAIPAWGEPDETRLRTIENSIDALAAELANNVPLLNGAPPVQVIDVSNELDGDDSYPDHGPEDDAAAAMGLPSKTAGTLPVRDDDYTPAALDRTIVEPVAVTVEGPPPEPLRVLDLIGIREKLTAAGMSQNWLAKKVGMTSGAFSSYLTGRREPSAELIAKVDEILAGLEPAPPTPEPRITQADELRALFDKTGLTQAQVADRMGISHQYTSDLLTGHKTTPSRITQMAAVLEEALPAPEALTESVATMREGLAVAIDVRREWALRFLHERTEKRSGTVITPRALTDAYDQWAVPLGGPKSAQRGPSAIGRFVKDAGYRKGRLGTEEGYLGLAVKEPVTEESPVEASLEHGADEKSSGEEEVPPTVDEVREAIAAARHANARVVDHDAEQAAADAEHAERERRRQLAELAAENAAIMERTGKDRASVEQRPEAGKNGLDSETRALIDGLLDMDLGWKWIPPKPGNSKSYVQAPDGARFRQASSHGGSVGRVGNNRELRRYLSRHGYLPTAASAVSELRKPQSQAQPDETLAADQAELIADLPSLPEDQLDRELFDLLTDYRAGMSVPFSYHPDVLALYGLNTDEVETAVREPQRVEVRPESKTKGYPVLKFVRGDVQVIMGYRDRQRPAVIAAYWESLLGADVYRVERHGGGGKRGANGLPTNTGALMKRLRERGAQIEESDGRTASVSYNGQDLGKITVSGVVTKAQVASDYQRCIRKMHAIDSREKVSV